MTSGDRAVLLPVSLPDVVSRFDIVRHGVARGGTSVHPLGVGNRAAVWRSCWHTWGMARRALTVEVDEKLLAATRAVAERIGVPADELYERALRNVLSRDFAELMRDIAADQVERGVTLSEDEGLALAYEELRADRAERRNAS